MLSLPESRKPPHSLQNKTRPKNSLEGNKKDKKSVPAITGDDAKLKRAIHSTTGVGNVASGKLSNISANKPKLNQPSNKKFDSDDDPPNLTAYMKLANKSYKVKSALGNIVQPGRVFVNDIIQKVNKFVKFGEGRKTTKEKIIPETDSTGFSPNLTEIASSIEKSRQVGNKSKIKISQKSPVSESRAEFKIPYPSKIDAYCKSSDLNRFIQDVRNKERVAGYFTKKSNMTPHKHMSNPVYDPKLGYARYAKEQLDVKMPAKIVSITKMQPKPKNIKNKPSRIPIHTANAARKPKTGNTNANILIGKIQRSETRAQLKPVSAFVAMALNKSINSQGIITKPILNPVVPNKRLLPKPKNKPKPEVKRKSNSADKSHTLPKPSPRPTTSKIRRPRTTQSTSKSSPSPKKPDKPPNKIKKRPKTKEGNKSTKNQDTFTRPVHCKDMKKATLDAHSKLLQDIVMNKEEEKKQCSFKDRIEKLRQTNEQTKKDIKRLLQLNTEERKLMTHHVERTRSTTLLGK